MCSPHLGHKSETFDITVRAASGVKTLGYNKPGAEPVALDGSCTSTWRAVSVKEKLQCCTRMLHFKWDDGYR